MWTRCPAGRLFYQDVDQRYNEAKERLQRSIRRFADELQSAAIRQRKIHEKHVKPAGHEPKAGRQRAGSCPDLEPCDTLDRVPEVFTQDRIIFDDGDANNIGRRRPSRNRPSRNRHGAHVVLCPAMTRGLLAEE
jgi:hypothetical protein